MKIRSWLKKNGLQSNQNHEPLLCSQRDDSKDDRLTGHFHNDINQMKGIFDRFSDIVFYEFQLGGIQKGMLICLDGMVDAEIIDSDVIKPLLKIGKEAILSADIPLRDMETFLQEQVIHVSQVGIGETIQEAVDHILDGDTVLLLDGVNQALFISAKGWDMRSVEEPSTEAVIRGPREGFTENLRTNTSLLRRRLKTSQLKIS